MNNYQKPAVVLNEGLAEGVFAASGEPECWTVNPVSVQDWDGARHVFEIRCVHSNTVKHISSATTVTLTFNNTVKYAYAEAGHQTTYSGNTVQVVRELHANAYQSGDTMTYKVFVESSDEAMTKALACTGATIKCTHQTNVQGEYD